MNTEEKLGTKIVRSSVMKNLFFIICSLNVFFNVAHAELFKEVLDLSQYKDQASFYYTEHAGTAGLNIISELDTMAVQGDERAPVVTADLSCDKNVTLSQQFSLTIADKNEIKFRLYEKSNQILLKIKDNTHCTLTIIDDNDAKKVIFLKSFKERFPVVESLQSYDSVEANRESLMLEDGEKAINRRVEILSGHTLTQAQLDERNPHMPLNLDNLPKFDFLYLSTLQINHDFVTNIVFRLLAAHAKKGTPVVVTVSEILLAKKELALLDWFQKQSSNIKIIRYKFDGEDSTLRGFFNGLHRVSHSKLFITYSKTDPSLNHFLAGGRNMSDRYFFTKQSRFADSQFTDYEHEKLNPWVHFYDLEFEIKSTKLVHETLMNALDFSHITHSNIKSDELILSVPFRDDKILEAKFVQVIDEATTSIEILSPYIYFTDKIQDAFERAAARGVKIKMIISFSLIGDAMTKQLKDIYDSFIDKVSGFSEIYQYPTEARTIMHRKAMVVDGKKAILGSVNLSQRSFYHDIESAFVTDDEKLVPQVQAEIMRMHDISKKIDRRFDKNFKLIDAVKKLL